MNKKTRSLVNNMIVTKNILAFKELLKQMNTFVFNKVNKDNSIGIQNDSSTDILTMEMDYQPIRTFFK